MLFRSGGRLLSVTVAEIFTLTVCNMGEAFRNSSRYEALCSSPGCDTSLKVVSFRKMKWLKWESLGEWKTNCSRLVEPLKMGSEGEVTTLG